MQPEAVDLNPPEPQRLDDQDFTFGVPSALRLLFVEVGTAIHKLRKCIGEYTLRECPNVKPNEVFNRRSQQFESRLIELSSDMKNGQTPDGLSGKAVLAMLWCFRWQIALLAVLLVIEMISRCSIPFVIEALLKQHEGHGSWLMGVLITVLIVGVLFRHNNWKYGQYLNLRIRTMLVKTLYKKLMRLSTHSLKSFDLSRAITVITSDLNSIELKMQYLFISFTAPFTLVYSLVMLIVWNGEEGLVGFTYFVGMFALHIIINKCVTPYTAQRSSISQQRIKVLRESLEGLRLLKIYSWQRFFSDTMAALRERETRAIFRRYLLLILERSLSLSSSAVASMLIFITEYYVGGKLEIPAVFATLQLFMLMRFNVMFFSQSGIDHYFELKEMMSRYLQILDISESKMTNQLGVGPHVLPMESPIVASMSNVSLYRCPGKPIIEELNLELRKGGKYCMTGRVAQGKSTFMYFLLKELPSYEGSASLTSSVSCTEQSPFIRGGTIKDNILLGREFVESRYREVIYEACLRDDLSLMEKGDETVLQPDGDNLSGGQRARINLARALYEQSDLYVFDDPLSACDENVAACIIERMFSGILRNKAVVMLLSSDRFIECFDHHLTLADIPGKSSARVHLKDILHRNNEIFRKIEPNPSGCPLPPTKSRLPVAPDTVLSTYCKYAKESGNILHWVVVAILFIGCEIIFSIYVLNLALLHGEVEQRIWTQTICLPLLLIVVYFVKYAYIIFTVCLTNRKMHNRLYSWLLNGRLAYFEQIERSDLISRFSNDMSVMDMSVPTVMCDAMESPLYFINLIIVVSIKVHEWAVCVPFLISAIFLIYRACNPPLQKSKSLDLKVKAQLITHFTVLIKGSTQLRCFNLEQKEFTKLKTSIVSYFRANHMSNLFQRGFGFFVQSGTLLFSILGILFTYFFSWDLQSGQELIYCIALSDYIQFGIRQIATLDSLMMSAQKLFSLESIPSEQMNEEGVELPENWPEQGRIEFKNVSMSYNNGKEALTKVSFVMEPGKKMGCLGRTGAGKTSLLNALFRLEPINEGQILLDGIDVAVVPLTRLRKSFGIIPQTPFIFDGTLRQNIDPYRQFPDQQIVQMLRTIQLDNLAPQLNQKNLPLSTGQRQLICLCRCLLNNPKILILDEASASIDSRTDQLIQQTLATMFKDRTVFSIAHRIKSISDSDKILMVADGRAQQKKVYNSYRELVAANYGASE